MCNESLEKARSCLLQKCHEVYALALRPLQCSWGALQSRRQGLLFCAIVTSGRDVMSSPEYCRATACETMLVRDSVLRRLFSRFCGKRSGWLQDSKSKQATPEHVFRKLNQGTILAFSDKRTVETHCCPLTQWSEGRGRYKVLNSERNALELWIVISGNS